MNRTKQIALDSIRKVAQEANMPPYPVETGPPPPISNAGQSLTRPVPLDNLFNSVGSTNDVSDFSSDADANAAKLRAAHQHRSAQSRGLNFGLGGAAVGVGLLALFNAFREKKKRSSLLHYLLAAVGGGGLGYTAGLSTNKGLSPDKAYAVDQAAIARGKSLADYHKRQKAVEAANQKLTKQRVEAARAPQKHIENTAIGLNKLLSKPFAALGKFIGERDVNQSRSNKGT
jgi:hypothetical protein